MDDDAFDEEIDLGGRVQFDSSVARHDLATARPDADVDRDDWTQVDFADRIGLSENMNASSQSGYSWQEEQEPSSGTFHSLDQSELAAEAMASVSLDDSTPVDAVPKDSRHLAELEVEDLQASNEHLPPSSVASDPPTTPELANSELDETSSDHDVPMPRSAPPASPNFPVVIEVPSSTKPTRSEVHLSEPPPAAHPDSPTSSRHRITKSVGPSAFEKVMSKTRPTFLPPKNKLEDNKHLADWEAMMKSSRLAEAKRKKALEERRATRERRIEESLHQWQREVVPNWQVVHRSPALRKLWWAGIPTSLRASMWESAVGNPLALNRDNFRNCLARAKRALSAKTFPAATMQEIEADILRTLPSLHIFHPETGPLYEDLKNMLCAWVIARTDEGLRYIPGIARIAGMFLLQMPPSQAFTIMRNLLERHCLRSFFGGPSAEDDVEAYYRIFDILLADGMPKIYFNFKQHQISPSSYLPDWLMPLFLDHLPFEACARIWDVFLLEGDSFLFRVSLAILAVLEPRLFFPERKELLEVLKGENRAAMEVAKRDGIPLDGGKYEIYGLDEETLWERIDSMDEWWKDSTWTRLLSRELPDV